jgi:RNA polymerase sigma factor (sigma-70 family)
MTTSRLGATATTIPDDADLVHDALAGDRQAFARLVERHQTLVCAITCAGTGSGEDLAQETFIEAWKSLSTLREPSLLRAWLAGIARNLVAGAARRAARTAPAAPAAEVDPTVPAVADEAIAREEAAIVRRALATLPAAYREPLLLFYWEDQSVARVAETLGLSEDAVKQRLARGRRLVRAELAAALARGLPRLRPGGAFTAAVVAALPIGAREAAAAGALAATSGPVATKLGVAATGGLAGGLAGSLVGLGGAVLGARASIVNTRSPRERRFMVRMVWVVAAFCLVSLGVQGAVALLAPALFRSIAWHAGVGLVETGLIVWLVLSINRRQRQIQIEDGTHIPPPAPSRRPRWVGFALLCLAYVVSFFLADAVVAVWFPAFYGSPYGQVTILALYGVGLLQLIMTGASRAPEGTPPPAPSPAPQAISRAAVYSSLGGGIGGSLCWMLPLCFMAGDVLTALVVVVAGLLALRLGSRAVLRAPQAYGPIAARAFLALGAFTLVVMNLRWEAWMIAYRQSALYQRGADLPLWAMNLLLVGVVVWTTVPLLRRAR